MSSSITRKDKKKQRRELEDEEEEESIVDKIDASKLPEYKKFLGQIEQLKAERLDKVQQLKDLELHSLEGWADAQRKQAWDDFYSTRNKIRSDLLQQIQAKIATLKQEKNLLNNRLKVQYTEKKDEDYENWIPSNRPTTISSFVGGATTEEIDNDFVYAKQGSRTPNLVYSDYESKSDTAEDSPHSGQDQYEKGRWWPNNTSTTTTA